MASSSPSQHNYIEALAALDQAAYVVMAPPSSVTNEQRHEAETVFLNFKKSRSPQELCKFILEKSSNSYVHFQAASCIKESILREWPLLEPSYIESLRSYLLQYVIKKTDLANYVSQQLLQAMCLIYKRGTDVERRSDRDNLFHEITQLLYSQDGKQQLLGCTILSVLLDEYGSMNRYVDTSLPWEFHLSSKRVFEQSDLKRVFVMSLEALKHLMSSPGPPWPDHTHHILLSFLKLSEQILTWRFTTQHLPKMYAIMLEQSPINNFKPGPSWSEVILDEKLIHFFFQVHSRVHLDEELSLYSLSCLSQLASLSGTVFQQASNKISYLKAIITNLVQMLTAIELARHESPHVATLFHRLTTFYSSLHYRELAPDLMDTFLTHLTNLTCQFGQAAALQQTNDDKMVDEDFFTDAYNQLLVSWLTFIADTSGTSFNSLPDDTSSPSSSSAPASDYLKPHCVMIVKSYIQCHLSAPDGIRPHTSDREQSDEIEDIEDDDQEKYQDQLFVIGEMARRSLDDFLPQLTGLLYKKICEFKNLLSQVQLTQVEPGLELSELQEDLHWLFLITGHVITADCQTDFRGSSISFVPQKVMRHSVALSKTSTDSSQSLDLLAHSATTLPPTLSLSIDPIIQLTSIVFHFLSIQEQALRSQAPALTACLSPQVAISSHNYLRKFVQSYLMLPEQNYDVVSEPIVSAFGADSSACKWCTKFLVSNCVSLVTCWHHESGVVGAALTTLITLVRSKDRAVVAMECGEVWQLASQHAANLPPVSLLSTDCRRSLLRALILAAVAHTDVQTRKEYLLTVLRPTAERLEVLVSRPDFSQTCHSHDSRSEVVSVLEGMCSAADAATSFTVRLLFPFLLPILSQCIPLLRTYSNYQQIVNLILMLYTTVAKTMIAFLSKYDTRKLFDVCLQLIKEYTKSNIGARPSEKRVEVEEEERYQDISLIMELLTLLISKEYLDFDITSIDNDREQNLSPEEAAITANDIALYGLNIIMPLLSTDLLKYPKLCSQYYKLLAYTIESDLDKMCLKIATSPEPFLTSLLNSIQLGLTGFGSDIGKDCFDLLVNIATYLSAAPKDENHRNLQNHLQPFLKLMFDQLLFEPFDMDLLPSASGAFHSLICCYQEEYQQLVSLLLSSHQQTNQVLYQRLLDAFTTLTPPNEPLQSNRRGRMAFKQKFETFLMNVRGVIQC